MKILNILHTNDIHSSLSTFSQMKNIISAQQINNNNSNIESLLLNSGDFYPGGIHFPYFKGKAEIDYVNSIGYDFSTFGNHEFDYGSTFTSNFIKCLNFEFVSSNIDFKNDKYLGNLIDKKIFENKIINKNGLTIGLFGLTTDHAVNHDECEISFTDIHKATAKQINFFKDNNVDLIILLSHLGFEEDKLLSKQYNDIDIIIGAHTHTILTEPHIVNHCNTKTLIVQAGCSGQFLGDLTFSWENNCVNILNYTLHDLHAHPHHDPNINILHSKYKIEPIKLGSTKETLNGERAFLTTVETNLGNLVTDAFFHAAKKHGFDADFAILNSRGIRTTIAKGDIFLEDTINVLPFSRKLTIVETTGQQLIDALNNSLFTQVSNLKLLLSKENTVKSIQYFNGTIYCDIIPNQNYLMATNSFVGLGNDEYDPFKNCKHTIVDYLDYKLLADYIKELETDFTMKTEKRIITLNK